MVKSGDDARSWGGMSTRALGDSCAELSVLSKALVGIGICRLLSVSDETMMGGGVSALAVKRDAAESALKLSLPSTLSAVLFTFWLSSDIASGVFWCSSSASDFSRIGGRRESPSVKEILSDEGAEQIMCIKQHVPTRIL